MAEITLEQILYQMLWDHRAATRWLRLLGADHFAGRVAYGSSIAAVIDDHDRKGRSTGAGFYDYDPETGKRTGLWPGLREAFGGTTEIPLQDAIDRMLFAEAIETVKCLDEGVLETTTDANVGSILGIGFPGWTGGVARYMDQYPGGLPGFVARAEELAGKYGERFTPPQSLRDKAASGGTYEEVHP